MEEHPSVAIVRLDRTHPAYAKANGVPDYSISDGVSVHSVVSSAAEADAKVVDLNARARERGIDVIYFAKTLPSPGDEFDLDALTESRTAPNRFLGGPSVGQDEIRLFESVQVSERPSSYLDWSTWVVRGEIPETGALTVLFDRPNEKPGLIRSVAYCRVFSMEGDGAVVGARGRPGQMLPVGFVSSVLDEFANVQASVTSAPGYLAPTLLEVPPDHGASMRTLVHHQGRLFQSTAADLPDEIRAPMISFNRRKPYSLARTIPMIGANEAIERLGNPDEDLRGGPWRVDRQSFDELWRSAGSS